MNPGISAVVVAMAKHLNAEQPTVSNTYQCYLKVRATVSMTTA